VTDTAVDAAKAAVARAVKAHDWVAERKARGALATAVLRRQLTRWADDGVSLTAEQRAEVAAILDQLDGKPNTTLDKEARRDGTIDRPAVWRF
jgi:hypothetical protein